MARPRLNEISGAKSAWWEVICYPESLPPDWIDLLEATHVPAAISPLHDKDIEKDGTPKKPHFHVLIHWANNTTFNAVYQWCKGWGGATVTQVYHPRGAFEYLWHRNEKKKYKYDEKGLAFLSGFDPPPEDGNNSREYENTIQIFDIIEQWNVKSLFELIGFCKSDPSLLREVKRNSYFYSKIISNRIPT